MKILDCTLRDGGYYTNWDFDKKLVDTYIESLNHLPVEYIEIGYRSIPQQTYRGEYFYCPNYLMKRIKAQSDKKLTVMLNEKETSIPDLKTLIKPCSNLIDLVRLAVNPDNFLRALRLAEAIKDIGLEVAFNVMYMSKWKSKKDLVNQLKEVDGIIDYFNMVDSFGGVYPNDVKEIFELVRAETNVKIGFHGHNNMELALINTLTAIECGADIVDVTFAGMGRGAGNLKTELLLTALYAQNKLEIDFNFLSKIVAPFSEMQKSYGWGTNLPYIISGANSLPQKDVMDWISNKYYSFNTIIRALSNKSKGIPDNIRLEIFQSLEESKYSSALIIGGGSSPRAHLEAIQKFLQFNKDMVVIHASSKNANFFKEIDNEQIFCLVGDEGYRAEETYSESRPKRGSFILPPFPRKMGTYIPTKHKDIAYELAQINFTDNFRETHTAIAIETSIQLGVKKLYFTGYDGYAGVFNRKKEINLMEENKYLFSKAIEYGLELISVTETQYDDLIKSSAFSYLINT
jgi:4-hydroxy 2-oxovalerate aldolase